MPFFDLAVSMPDQLSWHARQLLVQVAIGHSWPLIDSLLYLLLLAVHESETPFLHPAAVRVLEFHN